MRKGHQEMKEEIGPGIHIISMSAAFCFSNALIPIGCSWIPIPPDADDNFFEQWPDNRSLAVLRAARTTPQPIGTF